jgi:hypothetical protein
MNARGVRGRGKEKCSHAIFGVWLPGIFRPLTRRREKHSTALLIPAAATITIPIVSADKLAD